MALLTTSSRIVRAFRFALLITATAAGFAASSAGAATVNVSTSAQLLSAVTGASAGDDIVLAAGTYLPTATLDVPVAVTIEGPATSPGAIISGASITSAAANTDVIDTPALTAVTLKNLTVTAGDATGFAISALGTLTLANATLTANNGIALQINPGATADITNTTIAGNAFTAIQIGGTATITNSTIAGNARDGIANSGLTGFTTLTNSIVAGNGSVATGTSDCSSPVDATSASLDVDGTCGVALTADPLLGALGSNGGPAQTRALGAGSPAIGVGDVAPCPAVDERYVVRPVGQCDLGAYETIDATAPVLTTPGPVTAEATGPGGTPVPYTVTATDATNPASALTIACTPAAGTVFALGATTVSCTASDPKGNRSTASFVVTVRDTSAPVLAGVPLGITVNATSAAGATVTWPSPTATDAVSGTVTPSCTPASGSTFAIAVTSVACTAADAAGNVGRATFPVTVRDVTAPVITAPSAVTAEATAANGAIVSYSASATDVVAGPVTPSCTPASGTRFAIGATTVTCTATDTYANTATRTFVVTVRDTTAPALGGVPANITVYAPSGAGASVSYATPTATDAVAGSPPVTCAPASGALFAIGTTTVACSASDVAGNVGRASFSVTVNAPDTTPPAIAGPASVFAEATGPAGAAVPYTVTASDPDNAPATLSLSCSPASGSTFALGTTTVTCTASDPAGNSASKSFPVTVRDTTAPSITGVPADIRLGAPGGGSATVTYATPVAADAVSGAPAVTCTPPSGSAFAQGATTVTCTARDGAGNVATASFTVTVTAGINCVAGDGRISGRGSEPQAALQTLLAQGFRDDLCGAVPSHPDAGTTMVAYDYAAAAANGGTGAGQGPAAMACRTDAFAGVDEPYDQATLAALQGPPGPALGACPSTWSGPFQPKAAPFPAAADAAAPVMSFPIGGSAVALIVNLPVTFCGGTGSGQVAAIKLSARNASRLLGGDIQSWDDPRLVADNPSLAACGAPVTRIVRADAAGTTLTLKRYLVGGDDARTGSSCEAANRSGGPTPWTVFAAPSANLSWPGLSSDPAPIGSCSSIVRGRTPGNAGVITRVRQTAGSVGYADLPDVEASGLAGITMPSLRNATDTVWTTPNVGRSANCRIGVTTMPGSTSSDVVGLNSQNDNWAVDATPVHGDLTFQGSQYPACGLTYMLVFAGTSSTGPTSPIARLTSDQRRTLGAYGAYILSSMGQDRLSSGYFTSLPPEWLSKLRAGFQANY